MVRLGKTPYEREETLVPWRAAMVRPSPTPCSEQLAERALGSSQRDGDAMKTGIWRAVFSWYSA